MAQALASCSAMQLASSAASGLGAPLRVRSRPAGTVGGASRAAVVSCRAEGKGEGKAPPSGLISVASSWKPVSLSLGAGLTTALPAQAIESTDIVDALEKVETFAQKTVEFLIATFQVTKSTVETVIEVSTPVLKAAAPVVRDAAQSAYEAATPVVADSAKQAAKFLEEQGVDLAPVVQASKTAQEVTSSFVSEASAVTDKATKALEVASPVVNFLASQSPAVLAAEAGLVLIVFLSIPVAFSNIVYSIRGHAGALTPAQTLDNLMQGDYTLVDVRTEEEKEESGIPALPRNTKRKMLPVAVEDVREDIRAGLKNPKALEGELTAIKIASLKKLGRGTKVIILDSKGDVAPSVARSLSSLGFRQTYIVQDGFDGSQGWANSQLAIDLYESRGQDGTTKIKRSGGGTRGTAVFSGLMLPSKTEEGGLESA